MKKELEFLKEICGLFRSKEQEVSMFSKERLQQYQKLPNSSEMRTLKENSIKNFLRLILLKINQYRSFAENVELVIDDLSLELAEQNISRPSNIVPIECELELIKLYEMLFGYIGSLALEKGELKEITEHLDENNFLFNILCKLRNFLETLSIQYLDSHEVFYHRELGTVVHIKQQYLAVINEKIREILSIRSTPQFKVLSLHINNLLLQVSSSYKSLFDQLLSSSFSTTAEWESFIKKNTDDQPLKIEYLLYLILESGHSCVKSLSVKDQISPEISTKMLERESLERKKLEKEQSYAMKSILKKFKAPSFIKNWTRSNTNPPEVRPFLDLFGESLDKRIEIEETPKISGDPTTSSDTSSSSGSPVISKTDSYGSLLEQQTVGSVNRGQGSPKISGDPTTSSDTSSSSGSPVISKTDSDDSLWNEDADLNVVMDTKVEDEEALQRELWISQEEIDWRRLAKNFGVLAQKHPLPRSIATASDTSKTTDEQQNTIFEIDEKTLSKYEKEILYFLDPKNTSMTYKSFITLMKQLGGKIYDSTGSSHQRIEFIKDRNIIKKITLVRPHNQQNEIIGTNLNCLKKNIKDSIPEAWLKARLQSSSASSVDNKNPHKH